MDDVDGFAPTASPGRSSHELPGQQRTCCCRLDRYAADMYARFVRAPHQAVARLLHRPCVTRLSLPLRFDMH